jgi:hypothetical protein
MWKRETANEECALPVFTEAESSKFMKYDL